MPLAGYLAGPAASSVAVPVPAPTRPPAPTPAILPRRPADPLASVEPAVRSAAVAYRASLPAALRASAAAIRSGTATPTRFGQPFVAAHQPAADRLWAAIGRSADPAKALDDAARIVAGGGPGPR